MGMSGAALSFLPQTPVCQRVCVCVRVSGVCVFVRHDDLMPWNKFCLYKFNVRSFVGYIDIYAANDVHESCAA